jgi:hypothetical protein
MTEHSFSKENNRWYIDLPEWTGSKSSLQMVMGADTMLDLMAKGDTHVSVQISFEPIPDSIHLRRGIPAFGGRMYKATMNGQTKTIWLCEVTKFVFNEFPKHMYISKDIKSYK